VFTKSSLLEGPGRTVVHNLKRDSILREAEASLERLGIDAIDLYQIHWPVPDEDIEEGWAAMAEVKERGLARHIGVSNFSVEQLQRIQQIAPVETLQPQYSLVERDVEEDVLPFAEREDIGVIVYSPMGSGLLSGGMTRRRIEALPDEDWRKRDPRFQEPQLSQHLALVERLQTVAGRHDTSPGAVAVAWTLRNPAVDGAIVGFRRPDQVDPILTAAALELTDADVGEIGGDAKPSSPPLDRSTGVLCMRAHLQCASNNTRLCRMFRQHSKLTASATSHHRYASCSQSMIGSNSSSTSRRKERTRTDTSAPE
jgi:aryl-alcohol dehydrogenase-like predicted oxidoreductase